MACIVIIVSVAIVTAYIAFLIYPKVANSVKIGTFNLSDYNEAIEFHDIIMDMPEEQDKFRKYLGKFDNEDELCILAHEIWIEMFDDLAKYQKPYTVDYDAQTDTWLVSGCLCRHFTLKKVYRRAYMIVRGSDGKIIAMWADRD